MPEQSELMKFHVHTTDRVTGDDVVHVIEGDSSIVDATNALGIYSGVTPKAVFAPGNWSFFTTHPLRTSDDR